MQTKSPNVRQIKIDPSNPAAGLHAVKELLAASIVQSNNQGKRVSGHEYNAQLAKIKKEMFSEEFDSKPVDNSSFSEELEEKMNVTYAEWLKANGFKDMRSAFRQNISEEALSLEVMFVGAFKSFISKGLNFVTLEKIAKTDYAVFLNVMLDLERRLPTINLHFRDILIDISAWLKAQGLTHKSILSLLEYQRMFKVLSAWAALLQIDYSPEGFPQFFQAQDMQFLLSRHNVRLAGAEIVDIENLEPRLRNSLLTYCLIKELTAELNYAAGKIALDDEFYSLGYIDFFCVSTFMQVLKKFKDLESEQFPEDLKIFDSKKNETLTLNAELIKMEAQRFSNVIGITLKSPIFHLVGKREEDVKKFVERIESNFYGMSQNEIDSLLRLGNQIARSYDETESTQSVHHILHLLYMSNTQFYGIQNHDNLLRPRESIHSELVRNANVFVEKIQVFLDKDVTGFVLSKDEIIKYLGITYTSLLNMLTVFGLLLDPKSKNISEQKSFEKVTQNLLELHEFLRKFTTDIKHDFPIRTLNATMLLPSSRQYRKPIATAAVRTIFVPDSFGNLYLAPAVYEFIEDFRTELEAIKSEFAKNQAQNLQTRLERDKKYKSSLEEYSKNQKEIDEFANADLLENQQKEEAKQKTKMQQKERKLQKSFLPRFKSYSESSSSSDQVPELSGVEKDFQRAMSLRLEGKYNEANKLLSFIAFETSAEENRELVLYSLVYLALSYVNQTSAIAKTCQRALIIRPNRIDAIFNMTRKIEELKILQNNLTIAIERATEITHQLNLGFGVSLNESLKINQHVMEAMADIKSRMTAVQEKFDETCEQIKENKRRFKAEFPELYYSGNPDNPSPFSQMLQAIQEVSEEIKETSQEISEIRTKHKESSICRATFLKNDKPTEVKDDFEIGLSSKNFSIMCKTSRLNPRHAEFYNQKRNEESCRQI